MEKQNPNEQRASLEYTLHSDSGYTANACYRASPLQYHAMIKILEQPQPHHAHESGLMDCTLLFIADDSRTNTEVAVYAYQTDDGKSYFATCPLDEWKNEFYARNTHEP